MTVITLPVLAGAIHRVDGPGFQERIDLADRIHAAQPTLLYSVLVMRRFGATMVQIEVLIELLLVIFTAMKAVGGKRPVISEELQERCLARMGGRARFIEGLAAPQVDEAIHDAAVKHPVGVAAGSRAGCDAAPGMTGHRGRHAIALGALRSQLGGMYRGGCNCTQVLSLSRQP